MYTNRPNLRKAAAIVAYLAVTAIFISGCKDDDNNGQLNIIFTDIPAEYNGLMAQSSLSEPYDDPFEGFIYAINGIRDNGRITNGKATIYYTGSYSTPFTRKGEYNISFEIFEFIGEDVTVYYWRGDISKIKISKTTTTISFNSLKKDNSVTYPYTVGGEDEGATPDNITITDIPAVHNGKYGFIYLLKPDDRHQYAHSYKDGILGGKSTPSSSFLN